MLSVLKCKNVGSRHIVSLLLICSAIVILVLVAVFQSGDSDGVVSTIEAIAAMPVLQDRLQDYCGEKVRHGVEAHSFGGQDLFELSHLLITIRHGDRSRIHSFPQSQTSPVSPSSEALLDNTVRHSMRSLPAFKLTAIPATVADAPKGESLAHALDSTILFTTPDGSLPQGQLTSRGFMQHVSLGSVLHNAYRPFLNKLHRTSQLYIRSTNYARTVQSVAALLTTLLPRHMLQEAERIPIEYYESEADEIMHGVGLRSSSHPSPSSSSSPPSQAQEDISGGCTAAVRLAMQQHRHFQRLGRVYNDLAATFGSDVTASTVTDLVDASLPLFCHRRPLPCANTTTPTPHHASMRRRAGCLSTPQLRLLLHEADRFYCARFAGAQGGAQATRLAFQPFLSEVLSRLRDSASSGRLLTVFSGHDTVVAPLLAVLGVYADTDVCVWPGYASRVVFELYTPRLSAMPRVSRDDVVRWQREQASSSSSSSSLSSSPWRLLPGDTQYVRVLFNGREITSRVPACRQARQRLRQRLLDDDWPAPDAAASGGGGGGEDGGGGGGAGGLAPGDERQRLLRRDFVLAVHDSPLCPLPALREMLDTLVAPHTDLRRACQ